MVGHHSSENLTLPSPEKPVTNLEASRLLEVDANPLLLGREKLFIKRLLSGCSVAPSSEVTQVEITGISAESKKAIEWMVLWDGHKRSPQELLAFMNPRDLGPQVEFNKSHVPELLDSLKLYFAGVTGNLDSIIERVTNKKGNCLEYSLVMQLVLKAYYPVEVADAQLLAFSSFDYSRHYYLYHKVVVEELDINFLTLFKGHTRWRSREEAEEKIREGSTGKQADQAAIYASFLQLVDYSLKKTD